MHGAAVIRNQCRTLGEQGHQIAQRSLAGMIRNNSLTFTVNNNDLGDPAPDETKELHIDYTLDGKDVSQTVAQDKTLKIPADSK